MVQPGVTNLAISDAVAKDKYYYAPDPSSQIACSIGGNIAENSGGVHCLKYGLTTNNVLGVEMVLMNGDIVRIGGKHLDAPGYDLLGVINGSEGLLGVITEVTVRILQKPETAKAVLLGFDSNEAGGGCVAAIIGAGINVTHIVACGQHAAKVFAPEAKDEFAILFGYSGRVLQQRMRRSQLLRSEVGLHQRGPRVDDALAIGSEEELVDAPDALDDGLAIEGFGHLEHRHALKPVICVDVDAEVVLVIFPQHLVTRRWNKASSGDVQEHHEVVVKCFILI